MTETLPHFLLVEDDDRHAKLIRRGLEDHHELSRLTRVRDGEEALAYLFRKEPFEDAPRPDVVLLDLKLPRVDGFEVLARLKEDPDLRLIPVIMLTTSDNEIDRLKAYDHHANSYVVKPVDFEKFQKVVSDLGLYWGIKNQRVKREP